MKQRGRNLLLVLGGPGDVIAPTVAITSTETSPSDAVPVPVTITFSEAVTGFVVGDITVSGGTLASFATTDNIVFTVNWTTANGANTMDIAAGVCKDSAGNDNVAATQFAITSVLYTLRDDFTEAVAAGSIDGTPATPGLGTRQTVDAENKLSIGAAGLTFAGGKASAAYGDPGYWLDGQARAAGKVMIASILTASVNSTESLLGWTTAQTGSNMANVVYLAASNNLVIYDGGSGYNAVGTWAVGTAYQVAVVLRAAGAFYFIKGGAFGVWTLILVVKGSTGATVYPSINNYNSAYSASTTRVPEGTYLPVPLLSDSFDRADGAAGTTDGAAHAEDNGGDGVVWSGSGAAIDTNQLKITPTEGAELATGTLVIGTWYKITASELDHFYTGSAIDDTFRAAAETGLDANNKVKALSNMFAFASLDTPDVYSDMILPAFQEKTQCGYILRSDSATNPQNFVMCYRDGAGSIKIVECVNGVYAQLSTTVRAFSANEAWRVRLVGQSIRLHWSTTLMASVTTNVTTGNIHGLFATNAANRFDTLCIFPAGTEGQHAALQGFFSGITTKTFLAIGDSKTACTSGIRWQDDMSVHSQNLEFLELSPRIAGDGWRVISPDMDLYLAQVVGTPDYALLNFGANDLNVTSEADFKSYYLSHLDKLHTKYPDIRCGLMRVWKRGADAEVLGALNEWIDYVISQRAFAFAGPDEGVYLEGGDDGETYTADGTHPNDAGYTLTAAQWRTAMGY